MAKGNTHHAPLTGPAAAGPSTGGCEQFPGLSASISESLTARVLSVVASRVIGARARTEEMPAVLPESVGRLADAATSHNPGERLAILAHLRQQGISDEDIVDVYIPAAARLLGEEWISDDRSFTDVTIASARLQAMLRDLSADWHADDLPARGGADGDNGADDLKPLSGRASAAAADAAPNILMVVRQDDQHTLGTMVAACQFRRMGVSVRLMLGQPDAAVFAMAQSKCFDMVTIALSSEERVESVGKLVKTLKSSPVPIPPIVVGGPLQALRPDLKTATGADHISSDTAEALRLCGLKARADRAMRLKVQV